MLEKIKIILIFVNDITLVTVPFPVTNIVVAFDESQWRVRLKCNFQLHSVPTGRVERSGIWLNIPLCPNTSPKLGPPRTGTTLSNRHTLHCHLIFHLNRSIKCPRVWKHSNHPSLTSTSVVWAHRRDITVWPSTPPPPGPTRTGSTCSFAPPWNWPSTPLQPFNKES